MLNGVIFFWFFSPFWCCRNFVWSLQNVRCIYDFCHWCIVFSGWRMYIFFKSEIMCPCWLAWRSCQVLMDYLWYSNKWSTIKACEYHVSLAVQNIYHKIHIFIISSLRHWQGGVMCQYCSRPSWIASCSVQKVWERKNKGRYCRRGCMKRFLLLTVALHYSAQMKTIMLTWTSRLSEFLPSNSLYYSRDLCL